MHESGYFLIISISITGRLNWGFDVIFKSWFSQPIPTVIVIIYWCYPSQTLNSQTKYHICRIIFNLCSVVLTVLLYQYRDAQNQCCQIKLYFVNKVIVIVLALVLPVSWLASAHPLEVWHPLRSSSICQHSLLHFTAFRQVTDLAPKYSLQSEIRGRVIEWQEFD